MPTVRYDFSHSFGGTPAEQSFKDFKRISPNAGFILSQIHFNQAHWFESKTPCLQNRLEVIATITGNSLFYDVVVMVSGTVLEHGSRNAAIPRVTGGLKWHYDDSASQQCARDTMRAIAPPNPPPRITPVSYQFAMRLQNGVPTTVCSTTTAGGMTITNPAAGGLVSLQNLSIIQVDIIIYAALIRVPNVGLIPGGESGSVPILTPGLDTSTDTESYGFVLKPVDENLAAIVATDSGQEYAWREGIPEDEAGIHRLLSAFRLDLAALRALDAEPGRPGDQR